MVYFIANDQSCSAVLTQVVVPLLTPKCHNLTPLVIPRASPHLQAGWSRSPLAVYQVHGISGSLVVYARLGTEQAEKIVSSGSWPLKISTIPVHSDTAIASWGPSRYGILQADCHPCLMPPRRCVRWGPQHCHGTLF